MKPTQTVATTSHSTSATGGKRAKATSTMNARTKLKLLKLLTRLQTGSAISFSTFLMVHLSSPLSALVGSVVGRGGGTSGYEGAVDWASRTMILGRVYYQNPLTEPILIWGSLSIHVASSIARRWLLVNIRTSPSAQRPENRIGKDEIREFIYQRRDGVQGDEDEGQEVEEEEDGEEEEADNGDASRNKVEEESRLSGADERLRGERATPCSAGSVTVASSSSPAGTPSGV
ncbi:hypothetical protein IE53DRAFT_363555 [Violaceomyces palustris]|uniref:Uncharacterized protein n=1 Tax=Violaceomyces palustris TaxID=1673888 RepID=A0ACD0NSZ8_9BASI|nr:hypothetical protein IE53DRAFT_363555 [Violaceomyces palustris]